MSFPAAWQAGDHGEHCRRERYPAVPVQEPGLPCFNGAAFRQMEDILADEMYHVVAVSGMLCYFGDPSLRNAQMPREAYNGATPYMKYWWFDKA